MKSAAIGQNDRPMGFRVARALVALGVAVPLAAVLGAGPAPAAFPGENGKIAFVSNHFGNDDVFVYATNGAGSTLTRLTNSASSDDQPAFSPDGTRIVFTSHRDGNDEIYVMDADGSDQTRLTNNSAFDFEPAFSPDGTQIVFTSTRNGVGEVYVMDADGGDQTRLTNNPAVDGEPAFSPDGAQIVFTSTRDGNFAVFVMNADGTGPTNLTNGLAADVEPAFSPDGTQIAFTSNRHGSFEVYLMNVDGTNQTRLTNNAAEDRAPAFSPDGIKIAFQSDRDDSTEIYVMDADGTDQTRFTNGTATSHDPDWGPAVDDVPPTAVDDSATVDEGAGASAIDVLANDTDSDGGPKVITSAADPANGTVVLTGPVDARTGLTYEPDSGYCNDPDPAPADTFDYSLNGGSSATVSVTVTCVDTTAPETTITDGPEVRSNDTTPTFEFTSSEPDSTFACRVGGTGPFVACASPHTTTTLDEGGHLFEVRASDSAGNTDITPATRLVIVDTTAPATQILSGPDGVTSDATPTFEFHSGEAGTTWECRLDDDAFEQCETPYTTAELADGEHTMHVRAIDIAGNVDQTPASRTFTVDTVDPDTTITGGPDGPTSDNTPTFMFTSSEDDATFECGVGGVYSPCTSPHTTGNLGDGDHTFRVRARDAAGHLDPTPATRSFTLDRSPPGTSITDAPDPVTSDSTPTFGFISPTDEDATFECRVDSDEFAACTSPHTTAALGDGEHTFHVRAIDAVGNVDPDAAGANIRVDTTAPETTIADGPTGLTTDNTPFFSWDSDVGVASFECRLDDAPFAECEAPVVTGVLSDGEHTFELRAIDTAGNVDPTPDSRTFTVDTVVPDTTITGGPEGLTNDATPTFTFTSTEPGATFECFVSSAGFEPCTSPYTYAEQPEGSNLFVVHAIDTAGNIDETAATRSFRVDTVAPNTTITSGPSGPTADTTPTFEFSSDPGATFECRVDDASFAACTSAHTTAALGDGAHTFQVRAIDAAGNVDPTPDSRAFVVDGTAPDTMITAGPTGTIGDETPTFDFGSPDAGATFECRVDSASFAPCTSPHTSAVLDEGEHTFEVRATDATGNTDPTPASSTFTVDLDTEAPQTTLTGGPTPLSLSSKATLSFTSSEAGSTFECRLDGGGWQPCTSPRTYTGIGLGNHTFQVRAIDPAGNVDPSPAQRTWFTLGLLPF